MVFDWGFDDDEEDERDGDNYPPRRKSIPKAVKDTVWSKYIGANNAEGKCYVCSRTIHITSFDLGHDKARANGGNDHINNLRPICRTCNSSMGTTSIEVFKKKYFSTTTTISKRATIKPKIATTKQKTTTKAPAKTKKSTTLKAKPKPRPSKR